MITYNGIPVMARGNSKKLQGLDCLKLHPILTLIQNHVIYTAYLIDIKSLIACYYFVVILNKIVSKLLRMPSNVLFP